MPLWQICKNFELVIQRIKQAISVLLLLFYVFSFGELLGIKVPYLVPYKYHKLVEYEIPYNVLYEIKVIKIKEEETKAQQTPQIYELFDRRVTENELEEFMCDDGKVTYREVISNRFASTEFKKLHEDLYKAFTKKTSSMRFTCN